MLKIATNMSRRREIEAPSNARIVFGPGSPPGTPYQGVAPGPQLGPKEISADGSSAHQQKFPTISLHIGFHGNIPRWGISQLGISLVSSDLVCFSIN